MTEEIKQPEVTVIKSFEEMNDKEKIEYLQNQVLSLQNVIMRKGIENRGLFLLELMGSRDNKGDSRNTPLVRFMTKVLDEIQLAYPFKPDRKTDFDLANEAKYDASKHKIQSLFHQALRKEVSDLLKEYSVIQVGQPKSYTFEMGGVGAVGSERKEQ